MTTRCDSPTYTRGVPPAVVLEELRVRYGSITAVDGLSLQAERGQVTAIVGANGAGKTTTIETCEGLRRRSSGSVRVLGLDPERDGNQLHTRVGVMLQEGGVPSGARATEALAHMARLYRHPLPTKELLDRLGLANVKATYRRMSGGEQQRLKFAIAVVGRPELVFLDEPTAGLDAHAKRDVWAIVEEMRSHGVSIILTTHLMDDVERLADQIHVIKGGEVLTSGTASELTSRAQSTIEFTTDTHIDLTALSGALPAGTRVHELAGGKYQIVGGDNNGVIAALSAFSSSNDVRLESLQAGRRFEDVFVELTAEPQPQEAS